MSHRYLAEMEQNKNFREIIITKFVCISAKHLNILKNLQAYSLQPYPQVYNTENEFHLRTKPRNIF
jgi:hypothetical protein